MTITSGTGASVGYPDASNSPSVSGSTLTYYPGYPNDLTPATQSLTLETGSAGEYDTTSTNQVIEGLDITASVIVKHPGVTVRRCRIRGWDFTGVLSDVGAFTGAPVTIEDCVICDPNTSNGSTAVAYTNYVMQRCNIYGVENGADIITGSITDSYIHDLFNGAGDPHSDCIQTSSGVAVHDVTVRHNTLLCRGDDASDGTSCIINAVGSSSFTDCTYDDNVMAGGAYCFYGPQSTTGTRVAVTSNKFAQFWHSTAASFGPWTDATDEATVTGNQLGNFSGGINALAGVTPGSSNPNSGNGGGVITGTWSGSAIP